MDGPDLISGETRHGGQRRRNNAARRAGFGVAPILYMLGLIGVGAGVLFSGYSQSLKNNINMTNSFSVKSDLDAAATTLAATSVLSGDSTLLCPPQGGIDTSVNCANAPEKLKTFYTATSGVVNGVAANDIHLPADYVSVYASGSPVEVGVPSPSAGVKQVDPWGHYYIICRWESSPQSSSPAIQILSAGPDGRMQTKCGAATASGDDAIVSMNAATAVNRAAVWQTGTVTGSTTPDVYYGVGQKISVDANGNMTIQGNLTTDGNYLSSAGNMTLTSGNLTLANGDLTAARGIFAGSLSAESAAFNVLGGGTISAVSGAFSVDAGGTVSATNGAFKVTAGGALSAAGGTFSVAAGGAMNAAGGAFAVETDGGLTIGSGTPAFSVIGATGNTLVSGTMGVSGLVTLGSAGTALGSASLLTYGGVNIGTTLAATGSSTPILTVGKGTGTPTAYPFQVDQAGNVTASNFSGSFNGTLSGSVNGGTVTASSITDNGTLAVAGNYTSNAGNITLVNGTVTAANFVGNISLGSGGLTMSGVLPVANGGTGANAAATALYNLGVTDGSGRLLTSLLTSSWIPGADIVSGSITSTQLNQIVAGGSAKTYNWGTVGTDGRVTSPTDVISVTNGITDGSGDSITAASGSLTFAVGSSTQGLWNSTGLMVGSSTTAKNKLDVYGAVAVGTSYAGVSTAPTNGLIVVGSVGIGTAAPNAPLQVYGGEVQVGSSSLTCTALSAGAIRYANGTITVCDGTNWDLIGGSSGGSLPALANGDIWVGNAQGQAAAVAMSGDVTLSNAGVATVNGIKGTTVGAPTGVAGSAVVLANTPTISNLTISGTSSITFGGDYSTIGAHADVALNTVSAVRYTGVGAATFYGIIAGASGQVLYLHNASSSILTLANLSSSETTAANRIMTGTGKDLAVAANTSVTLQYDSIAAMWRIIGGSTSGGGTPAGTTGQVQYNENGELGADSHFFWDNTNKMLAIGTGAATPIAQTGTVAGVVMNVIPQASPNIGDSSAGGTAIATATAGQVAYYPGANSLAGTSSINISSGNVGIGTTTATQALTINGNVDTTVGSGYLMEVANDAGTGTVVNKLAKLTASGAAVLTAGGDTDGVIGIVVGGAGKAGFAQIAVNGQAICVFDGPLTTGHFVAISATTAGACTDAGASRSANGQTIGRVLNAGTGLVALGIAPSSSNTGALASQSGGVANFVTRWTGATVLSTGTLYDDGTKVGIGSTSPTATFDVVGDIRNTGLNINSFGTDYTTTGAQSDVALGTSSSVRYAGNADATFYGIVAGVSGQILRLHNASTHTLILADLSSSESTAANRIVTGLGIDLDLSGNSSVILQYDGTAQLWRVIGGSGIAGIAAGTTGQIQFNSGATTFAADSKITWDNTNKQLTVGTGAAIPVAATGTVAGFVMNIIPQAVTPPLSTVSGGILINQGTIGNVAYYSGANTVSPNANVTIAGGNVSIGTSATTQPLTVNGNIDATGGGYLTEIANAAAGTAANKLAKIDATGAALTALTSDTDGIIGIVVGGAGTTGSAQIAVGGQAICTFDGAATAGHFVGISPTVAGNCTDAGATRPTSGQTIGRVLNAGTGLIALTLSPSSASAGGIGGGGTGVANYAARWTNTTTIGTGALYDNGTNIGIGTALPGAKLDVNGGIHPGPATAGSSCSGNAEGTFAYDTASHVPVYCNASGTWASVVSSTVVCLKPVTSYLNKANPYGVGVSISYLMVGGGSGDGNHNGTGGGGGGGSSAILAGGSLVNYAAGGSGSMTGYYRRGASVGGTFTLASGATLTAYVGGGGGGSAGYSGGGGGGGAGYMGGGGGGNVGNSTGGLGGTNVPGTTGTYGNGGAGSGNNGGTGNSGGGGGTTASGGATGGSAGGGGSLGGGGGSGAYNSRIGGAGGGPGLDGSIAARESGYGAPGVGAASWLGWNSFSLPPDAGISGEDVDGDVSASASISSGDGGGGSAGFVIMQYTSPNGTCSL